MKPTRISSKRLGEWWAFANAKEPPFERHGLGWTEDMVHGAFVVLDAIIPAAQRKAAWACYLRQLKKLDD